MARPLSYKTLALFLICGCISFSKDKIEANKAIEASKTHEPIVIATPPKLEKPAGDQATMRPPAKAVLSRDEVKMLQARLKAAGFYAGPIDGLAGPKTRLVTLRLQAACANLKDMLDTSNREILPSTTEAQRAKLGGEAIGYQEASDVRMVQVRLKDAGFDPGPIDGVMGAKTKAALFRFQAACTMLKNLPSVFEESQLVERQISPISASMSHSEVDGPATGVGIESGKETAARSQFSSQEIIRQEQMRLKAAGFDPGPIDGILGPKTKAARQQYEKSFALKKPNY
jgi:peptidoglycan hydrolase-like protein with peptidoglycan-binding domain